MRLYKDVLKQEAVLIYLRPKEAEQVASRDNIVGERQRLVLSLSALTTSFLASFILLLLILTDFVC